MVEAMRVNQKGLRAGVKGGLGRLFEGNVEALKIRRLMGRNPPSEMIESIKGIQKRGTGEGRRGVEGGCFWLTLYNEVGDNQGAKPPRCTGGDLREGDSSRGC